MEIVRRQILENDRRLIVSFLTNLPVTGKWPPPVLARLLSPPVQGGLLALFGPHGVLLPGPGDMSFYDRIAADVERPQHARTTAQVIGWPIEPAFGETSL